MTYLTLFERVEQGSLTAVAGLLGINKGGLSRVCSGELRVSNRLHDRCQEAWGGEYNLRGTHEESRRRHLAWMTARAAGGAV